MNNKNQDSAEIVLNVILAAMMDAVVERKLTQLKLQIQPEGYVRPQYVRIVIMPETMDREWPQGLGKTQQ